MKSQNRHVLPIIASSLWVLLVDAVAGPLDNWHLRNPLPATADLKKVAFGNGAFVAVGGSGAVLTSTNGINWLAQDSGTDFDFVSVAFGNGVYVAMANAAIPNSANSFLAYVVTSTNLVDWSLPTQISTNYLTSVSFLNGIFVANGNVGLVTSSDGTHWAVRSVPSDFLSASAYVNGTFFVYTSYRDIAFASPDGASWSELSINSPSSISQVIVANGIAVGLSGCGNALT